MPQPPLQPLQNDWQDEQNQCIGDDPARGNQLMQPLLQHQKEGKELHYAQWSLEAVHLWHPTKESKVQQAPTTTKLVISSHFSWKWGFLTTQKNLTHQIMPWSKPCPTKPLAHHHSTTTIREISGNCEIGSNVSLARLPQLQSLQEKLFPPQFCQEHSLA